MTAATPTPSSVPQRSGPIPSLTITGSRGSPRRLANSSRRRTKSSGQSAPARLKAEAARSDAETPAVASASSQARTISTRAGSGSELWISAVPASPRPSTVPSPSVTRACVFVLPPSTPRRSVPMRALGGVEPVGEVRAVRRRERVVELLGELDLAHERVRGEGSNPIEAVAAPRCRGGEGLVLAEHLDETPDVAGQR